LASYCTEVVVERSLREWCFLLQRGTRDGKAALKGMRWTGGFWLLLETVARGNCMIELFSCRCALMLGLWIFPRLYPYNRNAL